MGRPSVGNRGRVHRHDDGSIELRLLIAQRALAALASFRPTLDPSPWVAEAEEAAQEMFA